MIIADPGMDHNFRHAGKKGLSRKAFRRFSVERTHTDTLGLGQSNKCMHLSGIAYNLKKCLKFEQKRAKSEAGQLALANFVKNVILKLFRDRQRHVKLDVGYRT